MKWEILELLIPQLKASGKIFGAEYIKKDGSVTKINGRFGVHKFTKGTGISSPKVLTVWDNNRRRYTAMIPEKIVSLTCNGNTYNILSKGETEWIVCTTKDNIRIRKSRDVLNNNKIEVII